MNDTERKEMFDGEIAYIGSGSFVSGEAQAKQRKMQFNFQGINGGYQRVQVASPRRFKS